MRFSEFQEKEVINACDCCKLGYVEDLVIDEKKGKIEAIIIPKGRGICNFFCEGWRIHHSICLYQTDWTGYYSD